MRLRRRVQPAPEASELPTPSLTALLSASQAINSALGLEESLRVVLRSARELLHADQGSVMLVGDDRKLRIVAADGIPDQVVASVAIPLGEGISGRAAQTGMALRIDDSATSGMQSHVSKERGIRSALCVPLRTAGTTVGVLNLNLVEGDRVFDDSDLRLAQFFGDQAATAIHKARMLETATRRGEDLSLLLEASQGLIGVLEAEPLLTRVLDGAMKLAGARAGFVSLMDDEAGRLSLGVYQGVTRHDIREVIGRRGFIDLFSGELRVIAVGDADPLEGLGSPEDRAVLVGMRVEPRVRALLLLVGDAPPEARLDLLRALASQASLAIRNAQLYRQVGEKETELASIVYSLPNPVIVVDSAGRLVVANPAAEELFAFSADFQKQKPIEGALGHPELEAMLLGEGEETLSVTAGVPTPSTWTARVSRVQAPDTEGGRVLTMYDVTKEHEVEKMKEDFVSIIGHELRTPLTLIKGYIKTLLAKGNQLSEETRRDSLLTAESQAQRLERLIEDLLYVSHIETVRPPLHLEEVDLVALAEELLSEFQGRETAREFRLRAPAELRLHLDRTKIGQVLFHLLDNACKYSEADDPVEVEITDGPEKVELSVKDEGVGILSEDVESLFTRFHQVDTSSTREHGGTGVGLYISKAFVDAHKGAIRVNSVWKKGSTFRVFLPRDLRIAQKRA